MNLSSVAAQAARPREEAPLTVAYATMEAQLQAMKQLVRWNNEGAALLRTSVVKGRDAMALFQTALTTAVDLAESCDRLPPPSPQDQAEDDSVMDEEDGPSRVLPCGKMPGCACAKTKSPCSACSW